MSEKYSEAYDIVWKLFREANDALFPNATGAYGIKHKGYEQYKRLRINVSEYAKITKALRDMILWGKRQERIRYWTQVYQDNIAENKDLPKAMIDGYRKLIEYTRLSHIHKFLRDREWEWKNLKPQSVMFEIDRNDISKWDTTNMQADIDYIVVRLAKLNVPWNRQRVG